VAEIPKEHRFLALIEMLATGALHAMGKLSDPNDPDPGEPVVNLLQAQYMIALLEGLEDKTKGNLNDYEKRALDTQLTNLRLTYVDEFNRQKKGAAKSEEKPAEKPAAKEPEKSEPKTDAGFVDKRSSR
jgi:hypothetical protein